MRRAPVTGWLALALLAGCGGDAITEVFVEIDAEPGVEMRMPTVRVSVDGPDGRTDLDPVQPGVGGFRPFPFRVALTPRGGDADRPFTVTATASAADGSTWLVRLRSRFLQGKTVVLHLVLEDACRDVRCDAEDETCRSGECVSAQVDPTRPDGGVPDGGAMDAEPVDSGAVDSGAVDSGSMDAGPADAGCVGVPETCNGLDDDCDSMVDEGLTRTCMSDCRSGTEMCTSGVWVGCTAPTSSLETCNGVDDDCNGSIDDGLRWNGGVVVMVEASGSSARAAWDPGSHQAGVAFRRTGLRFATLTLSGATATLSSAPRSLVPTADLATGQGRFDVAFDGRFFVVAWVDPAGVVHVRRSSPTANGPTLDLGAGGKEVRLVETGAGVAAILLSRPGAMGSFFVDRYDIGDPGPDIMAAMTAGAMGRLATISGSTNPRSLAAAYAPRDGGQVAVGWAANGSSGTPNPVQVSWNGGAPVDVETGTDPTDLYGIVYDPAGDAAVALYRTAGTTAHLFRPLPRTGGRFSPFVRVGPSTESVATVGDGTVGVLGPTFELWPASGPPRIHATMLSSFMGPGFLLATPGGPTHYLAFDPSTSGDRRLTAQPIGCVL